MFWRPCQGDLNLFRGPSAAEKSPLPVSGGKELGSRRPPLSGRSTKVRGPAGPCRHAPNVYANLRKVLRALRNRLMASETGLGLR